jgi:hypothetical protein
MVMLMVLEPTTQPGSNNRFSMCVTYLRLIIFSVVDDVFIDSDALFVIDFMNLKIKSVQSFNDALVCEYLYCVSKKEVQFLKNLLTGPPHLKLVFLLITSYLSLITYYL